jgi:geranylgeranyl diphosphate synthase type II
MRSALKQTISQSSKDSAPGLSGGIQAIERIPPSKEMRERLRALSADMVASWSCEGLPADVKLHDGLRKKAQEIVVRANVDVSFVGWTMVTILSEVWRYRIASTAAGQRLLLLPDCPLAQDSSKDENCPAVCGPSCGMGTIWSAAHDSGWVVDSTRKAATAIGSLMSGQYQGILGVARLKDLEKAFGMLPAFSFPVAAVPFQLADESGNTVSTCDQALLNAGIDVEWVLSLLGVAGGSPGPVGDYLPLLREASELFSEESIAKLADCYHLGDGFGSSFSDHDANGGETKGSLSVTARLASEFLGRGGKFLRPFVTLAAYDALRADLIDGRQDADSPVVSRETARAAAVSIEIFHKASLVHDDIEDGDAARYGRPTVHVEHGTPAAINIGDYLVGAGYRLIAGLEGPASLRSDLLGILSDAHVRLARGQGAELWWRDVDAEVTSAESLEIYGLKTSPAFEAAVAMGIRLAGLQPDELLSVTRYSLHVGTGFQVLNDLKDWQGDLENDRRVAGDVLGGRPTVMWALALENLDSFGKEELLGIKAACSNHRIEAGKDTATAIQTARRLYQRAGVFSKAAAIVANERKLAVDAVRDCGYSRLREVLEFLLDLAVPQQAIDDLMTAESSV